MLFYSILGLAMSHMAIAQSQCAPQTPPSSGRVVLTYTPYVTPQIAPVSTVYNHIVTAWTYAVDCRYVSIQQVDANQAAGGPYIGTPTTVDALTITRIGCIQQTAAITRRDIVRGYPIQSETSKTSTPAAVMLEGEEPRSNKKLHKRATLKESVLDVAVKQADEIPPDAQGLSVKAYGYLVQVNTAIYVLNLYNTGFNMTATCTLLNDPITKARLQLASIDPVQAAGIVCYAAQYGLFFNMSNAQLLSDLLSIIYSIEIKSGFSTNTTTICGALNLGPASFLGIDAQGVRSYVCGDQLPPTTSTNQSVSITTTPGPTGSLNLSGTAGGTGSIGSLPTGPAPPYINSTTITTVNSSATRTHLSGIGTGLTTANATLTTLSSYTTLLNSPGTAAASDTFHIVFPNVTSGVNITIVTVGHRPPTPTASPYYAVWTTSTTSGPQLPRY